MRNMSKTYKGDDKVEKEKIKAVSIALMLGLVLFVTASWIEYRMAEKENDAKEYSGIYKRGGWTWL